MASSRLIARIDEFLRHVDEPHGIRVMEDISPASARRAIEEYLPRAIAQDEATKLKVLDVLWAGWDRNLDHGHCRRWGRAAINLAYYVLRPSAVTDLTRDEQDTAVDAIVRFSGWYHTSANFWIRFRPYAEEAVDTLWGTIEDLK